MSLVNEALTNDKQAINEPIVAVEPEETPGININLAGIWEFIKKDVGAGELKDYQDSPLCFDKSEGLGRVLWGLSGLIGYALKDLVKSAVIQITIGVFQWTKEKVKNVNPPYLP